MRESAYRLRLLAIVAVLGASSVVEGATSGQCSDPCLTAARAERQDCVTSASGAFLDAFTGCLARDHQCVDACRGERQDCRDATTLGAALAACGLEREVSEAQCRATRPPGSPRLAICIARAQIAGFRCRRGAFRDLRAELKDCRSGFTQCAGACGAGGPPGGSDSCRAQAKSAVRAALLDCKAAYRATASGCIDRDVNCVQECGEAADTCAAPTTAVLQDALASCAAARATAVAACQAANPGGGTALEQCLDAATASAFACREAAIAAARPGLAACTPAYVSCVRACPAA